MAKASMTVRVTRTNRIMCSNDQVRELLFEALVARGIIDKDQDADRFILLEDMDQGWYGDLMLQWTNVDG